MSTKILLAILCLGALSGCSKSPDEYGAQCNDLRIVRHGDGTYEVQRYWTHNPDWQPAYGEIMTLEEAKQAVARGNPPPDVVVQP